MGRRLTASARFRRTNAFLSDGARHRFNGRKAGKDGKRRNECHTEFRQRFARMASNREEQMRVVNITSTQTSRPSVVTTFNFKDDENDHTNDSGALQGVFACNKEAAKWRLVNALDWRDRRGSNSRPPAGQGGGLNPTVSSAGGGTAE